MKNSHSNAMIAGGSIIQTRSGLFAVLRKHVSQPSRQSHPASSLDPTPLQRATSFAKDAEKGVTSNTSSAGSSMSCGFDDVACSFIVLGLRFGVLSGQPHRLSVRGG
jgi:hypothetical protein